MKHRQTFNRNLNSWECTTCRRFSFSRMEDDCMAARHADPEIDKLYRSRRRAAEASNESGYTGVQGWGNLESIENILRQVDPDGDWRYEGNRYDGLGWTVRREGATS